MSMIDQALIITFSPDTVIDVDVFIFINVLQRKSGPDYLSVFSAGQRPGVVSILVREN
jgi:hypothetical protein